MINETRVIFQDWQLFLMLNLELPAGLALMLRPSLNCSDTKKIGIEMASNRYSSITADVSGIPPYAWVILFRRPRQRVEN
jgi:hypothetical protein